jgi:uncharacterized repeat protein (TIGR01451 family)
MVVLLGVVASRAQATATVCGTIITNEATATMTSGFPDFVGYEVSYNATCTVTVLCPPVVALRKFANGGYLTESAAGATVTFSICIENQTVDTVWGVTVTDQLPSNMTFVDYGTGPWTMGTQIAPWPPAYVAASSVAGLAAATNNTGPTAGQGAPYFMRWTFAGVGPNKSACVIYRAQIL